MLQCVDRKVSEKYQITGKKNPSFPRTEEKGSADDWLWPLSGVVGHTPACLKPKGIISNL